MTAALQGYKAETKGATTVTTGSVEVCGGQGEHSPRASRGLKEDLGRSKGRWKGKPRSASPRVRQVILDATMTKPTLAPIKDVDIRLELVTNSGQEGIFSYQAELAYSSISTTGLE